MAKKHKHEEHVNHERWVISFADMMTLLFALFVVLYALGVQDLEKLKALQKSIQFAFHIAGEGKTKDTGLFDQQKGGGEMLAPAPLLTAQDGEMREFLKEVLPDYEEVAGRSLTVDQTDDTVSLSAPLSDFFPPLRPSPIKREVQQWLGETLVKSLSFTSSIQIVIEAPEVTIGQSPDGRRMTSMDLCLLRLQVLRNFAVILPEVQDHHVSITFRTQREEPGAGVDWEGAARVTVAFSNAVAENR